jgi:hypothetical protein
MTSIMKPKGRDVLAELQANNGTIQYGADAAEIEAQAAPAAPATAADSQEPEAEAPAAEKRAPRGKGKGVEPYPWEEANVRVPKVFNLRLNEIEYRELWFLGETSLGESMHSIAKRGVMKEVHRMLRERGIEPPKHD